MILAAVGIVVILAIGGFFFMKKEKSTTTQKKPVIGQEQDAIPQVDSSVVVDLVYTDPRKMIKVAVKNIPSGTQIIEYSVTYDLKNGGLQGFNGEIDPKGKSEAETDPKLLGTESSGARRYDDVTGHMKVDMKFTGDYGERVFEKEYQL